MSFLQVLAVLHDNERESTAVLERAIELRRLDVCVLAVSPKPIAESNPRPGPSALDGVAPGVIQITTG